MVGSEILLSSPIIFLSNTKATLNSDVFLKKVQKRSKSIKVKNDANDVIDKVKEIFEKLSEISVVILGDGIRKYYRGDITKIVTGIPYEVLHKRMNVVIVGVKKDHIPLIEDVVNVKDKLNIAMIDIDELLKLEEKIKKENGTIKTFIEKVVEHFNLSLTFSKTTPATSTKKQLIYGDCIGLFGCIEEVEYCVEGLQQKQIFHNENKIKEAITTKEKIDGYHPIEYALPADTEIDAKCPVIYAIKNLVEIDDTNPILWAEVYKYKIGDYLKDPIDYAIAHNILIENKDAKKWML